MQRSSAYFALADWFEYLNSDCDYEKWSQYLHNQLKELNVFKGVGLDIGCGSGYFTRVFSKLGYKMTGFDVSENMLSKAQTLSQKEGVNPNYILCDILKLKTFERADFALCINDCLNYIPTQKLTAAFKKVYASLKKGGAFLFDISSEYKLREIIGNNTFCEDREEVAYIWFNKLFQDRVEMEFTLFAKRPDGAFNRGDEKHTQYIHSEESVKNALEQAGFTLKKVCGAFGDNSDKTRVNFVAVK